MEAMLYALATKFLDKTELRKVKEKINMTLLGQMLMEDGIEKGEMTKLVSLVMKKRYLTGLPTSQKNGV